MVVSECKKTRFTTFSGNNAALLALTIFSAVLSNRSEVTEVATMPDYFLASLAKFVRTCL